MLSILIGSVGCLAGVMGLFYFPAYLISAVLLGISAAWFPVANAAVNYCEGQSGYAMLTTKKYLFLLIIFAGLLFSLTQPLNLKISLVLAEYTLVYVAAYHTVSHYPSYEIDFNELRKQTFSFKEVGLFFIFLLVLILLWGIQLWVTPNWISLGILLAASLFLLATWLLSRPSKKGQLPSWLNVLAFVNGMCTNFILLVSVIYVSVMFGKEQLMNDLYSPYILGILCAGFFSKLLSRVFVRSTPIATHIVGLVLALCLLLLPELFPLGILLLSCCINGLSSLLDQAYGACPSLQSDQRFLANYSTQTKGSITQQLLMLFGLWLIMQEKEFSVHTVFQVTRDQLQNIATQSLVRALYFTSIIGFIVLFLGSLWLFLKRSHLKSID